MKLNYEFVKRELAGDFFLVPVGEATKVFDGILTINASGAFIFDCIPDCTAPEEIAARMTEVYDIDAATALADVQEFFEALRSAGIFVE